VHAVFTAFGVVMCAGMSVVCCDIDKLHTWQFTVLRCDHDKAEQLGHFSLVVCGHNIMYAMHYVVVHL